MRILLFCFLSALAACISVPQKLDPKVFYKRDMQLKVNGHQGEGVVVAPHAAQYQVAVEAAGSLDLFTFTTCHREQTKENAGERGWFSDRTKREFTFMPTTLESNEFSCPAQLGGYERKKGRHSWGFIEFESPKLTLPALVNCNGSSHNARGVSVCQSKIGLIQEIVFSEPVLWSENNSCLKLESKDSKTFRFKMPKGSCVFRFLAKDGDKEKWHRLTTIGYEKILIREN